MNQSTPIQVSVARDIAVQFHKSMVVILAYDPAAEVTHTTTYGVEPAEKEMAAEVGERCARLICGDGFQRRESYEDYRTIDQATRAREIELLRDACRSLVDAGEPRGLDDDVIGEFSPSLLAAMHEARRALAATTH